LSKIIILMYCSCW